MKRTLFFLAVFASLVFASSGSVRFRQPIDQTVQNGGTADLGIIGPGQTVELTIGTDAGVASALERDKNADWDYFEVIGDLLPIGWSKKDAKIYDNPLTAFVTAAKDAKDGEYYFNVRVRDDYEEVSPLVFRVKVRISRDVLSLSSSPLEQYAGVGTPAVYRLELWNRGSASDVFLVTVSGLPAAWDYSQKVYVPHEGRSSFFFEAGASEPGGYDLEFKAVSLSSDAISATDKSRLVAEATLIQDLKAAANGVLLFPSAQQAVVAILGYLANNFG